MRHPPSHKVTSGSEWLCKSGQEPVPKRGIDRSNAKVGSRESGCPVISSLLQVIPSAKAQSKVETDFGPKSTKSVSLPRNFQNGDPRNNQIVPTTRGVDAYFHIPIQQRSRKYLRFFLNGQTFQFTALPFGLATAPLEFTRVVKEVKLMAQARGIWIHQYLDDWLLSPVPGNLSTAYPGPLGPLP